MTNSPIVRQNDVNVDRLDRARENVPYFMRQNDVNIYRWKRARNCEFWDVFIWFLQKTRITQAKNKINLQIYNITSARTQFPSNLAV